MTDIEWARAISFALTDFGRSHRARKAAFVVVIFTTRQPSRFVLFMN